ncbi:coiled-coil domain-containing protein 39-like isoform X1 [Tachysurus fulvidraco]|uniref:coiled-coil domain-containing protein 39-like isoform X1 n=1 Tax=Tachysurus fulvidraco TaxID=1234273 RepID=UPI001FEF5FF5|nr:coiled-coil domain-containing protein 39-like isoform X1 [Tachysurus fulvidraco]
MSSSVLSEIISENGWNRKFAVPVSNKENHNLKEEIMRKQKEVLNAENNVCEYMEQIRNRITNLRNTKQGHLHIQALCRAIEKQNDTDLHFKALADRERGRQHQEISLWQSELKWLQEKQKSKENFLFKVTQKIEMLKAQMNWDQKTLDAWMEESTRKDDDIMVIVKYAQQDESRIRKLTLSMEKVNLESNQKRKALDNEVTDTIVAQVALEKTVEMVQKAHVETQELINQWVNSIEKMKQDDHDLQQCALLLTELYQVIRERKALIKEKQYLQGNEVENNKDCKKTIAMFERKVNQLRQQFQEEERNIDRLQDELVNIKCYVDRTATDVEAKRSHLASIKKDINDKTAKLEDIQLYNIALEDKMQAVTEEALSMEERAAHMEQLHRDLEKILKEIETQLQREHKLLFQKKQDLQTLRAKVKNVISDSSGSRLALSSMDSRLSKLDQDALKHQDYINNQEFQVRALDRKIAFLSGDLNKEEKEVLEKQVSELSAALEEKKEAAALLAAQLKKLQNDIRCVRKENEKTGAEMIDLTTKIDELNLIDDTLNKDMKRILLKKKESIVEKNILKLQVKRLRNLVYDKADTVLSMEKRKMHLQVAMKERQEEIFVYREMLCKQHKITEQDMHGLRAQFHERMFKVETMKKKYEIVTISMAVPEDEEGEFQAYYIIKAAQEREELQRKNDDLDAKVRKAEKENKALENTMQLFNYHESTYYKSINKVTESTPEYQKKLMLEEEKRAANEKVEFMRHQIRELQEGIEDISISMNSLYQDEAALRKMNTVFGVQISSLKNELICQQEKLDRTTKQYSKLRREVRSSKNTTGETFEERDIKLKELKDGKKAINKMILEVMEQHSDLQSILQMYFAQAGLALPHPSILSRASRLSSARSSTSPRSSRFLGPSPSNSTRALEVHTPSIKAVEFLV